MGSSDHNVLRWNEFHTQMFTNLQVLRDDDEFLDCTVACDENSQIQAHKLILSACSPYFRSMFRKVSTPHPVLIMPANIRFQEIVSLIDFMYHGEVAIPTEDVNQFLAVAEQFKVRGLCPERPKSTQSSSGTPAAAGYRKAGPPPSKPGLPVRPQNVPPDIRGRLPPGISMMKSGASPVKRPRLDHPPPPPEDEHEDITEIHEDEDDSRDFYPAYADEYDEQGWDGEPPPSAPVAPPPAGRGPQLMGLLCPHCRVMCHGVPALKEHMAVCQGAVGGVAAPPAGPQGMFPAAGQEEGHHLCHVCDKTFKSHRTLDNHMRKQHGLNAGPKPPSFRGSGAGRGKKTELGRGGLEPGRILEGDDAWTGPSEHVSPHPKEQARPVGQVAPAQRSTTPKSDHDPVQRMTPSEDRRGPPPHRGGRGRGMPMGRGMPPRPGMPRPHQGPPQHPGPSHHGGRGGHGAEPHRPDLQKLGLKFGGQISITSTGNQGKKMAGGPGDGQGVSIVKLKGDVPVGSPVNIREAAHKPTDQKDPKSEETIKTEPDQVKEEPKDFEAEEMEGGEEEHFEEYDEEGEFEEGDGMYQGDGDYEEGMEGEMDVEGDPTRFTGNFDEGYPEIGGDYDQEG